MKTLVYVDVTDELIACSFQGVSLLPADRRKKRIPWCQCCPTALALCKQLRYPDQYMISVSWDIVRIDPCPMRAQMGELPRIANISPKIRARIRDFDLMKNPEQGTAFKFFMTIKDGWMFKGESI